MVLGTASIPVFAEGNKAQIGSTGYLSLAAAIAAVPTDGTSKYTQMGN